MSTNTYRDDHAAAIELIEAQRRVLATRDEQIAALQHADYITDRERRRTFRLVMAVCAAIALGFAGAGACCVRACVETARLPTPPDAADETNFCEISYDTVDGLYCVRSYAYGARSHNKILGCVDAPDHAVDVAGVLECPLHLTGPRPTRPVKGTSTP